MNIAQILDMINIGMVVLDRKLRVVKWNRWMEIYSRIPEKDIAGKPIFNYYPRLNTPRFVRNFKSVAVFGNFAFFSQRLHRYLFPFEAADAYGVHFDHMQQSCTMGPVRDENNRIQHIFIMVQDVTEIASYEHKLLEMNMRDGLTSVFNRRYLETRLDRAFENFRRDGKTFSIIMQDIDFFKSVNDRHGHLCGDHILKSFTARITATLRKSDLVARYGGEEFCCLLPGRNMEYARMAAEVIRSKVEKTPFVFHDLEIRLTVSQGVAEIGPHTRGPADLLETADRALYRAKSGGRNRVVSAG